MLFVSVKAKNASGQKLVQHSFGLGFGWQEYLSIKDPLTVDGMSVRALKSVLVVGVKKQSTSFQDEKAFAMFYCSLELFQSRTLFHIYLKSQP